MFGLILFPCQKKYVRNWEIRCQNTQHNTCIFLVPYIIKILEIMNSTVNHMWFIRLVLSNIASRACVVICSFMSTVPHEHQYTSGFSKNWFLLDSYQDLGDYFMSSYKAHFVLLWKPPFWKITNMWLKVHVKYTLYRSTCV